jgi:hypothetical protein
MLTFSFAVLDLPSKERALSFLACLTRGHKEPVKAASLNIIKRE